jgi:peptide/nickel transport system permease protein
MAAYVVRRLLYSVFVVAGLVIVVFVVSRFLGDAARLMLPIDAAEQEVNALRHNLGLDQPVHVQLVTYILQLAHGDFGTSLWQGVPAMQLVLSRFPATLYLAFSVIAFSLTIALPMGVLSAIYPRSLLDRITTIFSFVGISMPTFWLALMLITFLAVQLGWFRTSGYGGPEYLVLPLLSLAVVHIGRIGQVVRSSVLDELAKGYMTTARSKGLPERVVIARHALKNAALPIITLTADELAGLVNGSVVIEVIFGWPGIGLLAMEAIQRRDFPVIQADVLLVACSVVILNLLVDLTYAYLDPRIRYG